METLSRREALLLLGGALSARAYAQQPTFSTAVKVVDVLVSARDKQNRLVSDLTQADFEILEDQRLQQVRYFARQTDIPLTLGMLVDTSQSQRSVMDEERNAAKEFFWEVLRPAKDNAFVIRFDVEVELAQDSTNSLTKLSDVLETLDVPTLGGRARRGAGGGGAGGARGGGPGGGGPRREGVGTLLYDAIFLAADEVLKEKEGRKAAILLSDGADVGSKTSLNTAIEFAQKADTAIYAIRMGEGGAGASPLGGIILGGGGGGRGGRGGRRPAAIARPNGEKIMRRLAEETGGRYFEVSRKTSLEVIFKDIEQELRNQYSLGYVSDRTEASGEFRAIEVRTKRKNVTVQARKGYYAVP
ncbi:MAG: VWA domain-containing protein [Acidobacteriota bacterium]